MENIINLQDEFLEGKSKEHRKDFGQFFTGPAISDYMASLAEKNKPKNIRLLDAGAGTGILTASTAMHCLNAGCDSVHAVLYELDSSAITYIHQTLETVVVAFDERNSTFTFEVINKDFILARPDMDEMIEPFDISVINPPYFKYSVKDSPYAKAVSDLYKGDPNIYASFMGVVLSCLNPNGYMISITPRSFTNGLYFKGFRRYLLEKSCLDLIHIFKSRSKVFQNKNTNVLQENVICRFIKRPQNNSIIVRTSLCGGSIEDTEENKYDTDLIIDSSSDQKVIRVPESKKDAEILDQAEHLETTFEKAGFFISTGPVVEHRTREFISENNLEENSIPLYRPHNVKPIKALWDGSHKKDVSFQLNKDHEKHTIKDCTYVLLKRFSSKDEKRRLVSGVHFKRDLEHSLIGFGNKVNYMGVKGEIMSHDEAIGLSAVFNSTFMDRYFRCISGNTQVNATEIRILKFPSRETVTKIGVQVNKLKLTDTLDLDEIVNTILNIDSSILKI